jgi:hypothetical protein
VGPFLLGVSLGPSLSWPGTGKRDPHVPQLARAHLDLPLAVSRDAADLGVLIPTVVLCVNLPQEVDQADHPLLGLGLLCHGDLLQGAPPVGGLGLLDELGPGAVFCLVCVSDRGHGYGKGLVLYDPVDGVPLVDAPVGRVPVHLGEQTRRLVPLALKPSTSTSFLSSLSSALSSFSSFSSVLILTEVSSFLRRSSLMRHLAFSSSTAWLQRQGKTGNRAELVLWPSCKY